MMRTSLLQACLQTKAMQWQSKSRWQHMLTLRVTTPIAALTVLLCLRRQAPGAKVLLDQKAACASTAGEGWQAGRCG